MHLSIARQSCLLAWLTFQIVPSDLNELLLKRITIECKNH